MAWKWLNSCLRRRKVLLIVCMSVLSFSFCSMGRSLKNRPSASNGLHTSHRRLMEDTEDVRKMLELFSVSDFTVIGPSTWPKPSAQLHADATPLLKPTFGQHRPDQDAVMAFAAEYGLNTYLSFVTTLRQTGFTGDIVFAVSKLDLKQKGVEAYLSSQEGLVVYVIDLQCFNAEGEQVDSVKGGMRVCQLPGLYQHSDFPKPIDPRPPRTVATTRYELYWIWTVHYQPHSWIMLLDARDAFFQTNPFANVPREQVQERPDGILYFFGENTEATRIGRSPKNRKWLSTAYGEMVIAALEDKPTICSGSTMGEQVALEIYLRAMVKESDETGTVLMGADQGFHNYLYYTNKLANAESIRGIVVFDQGRGIINNLGAMRTKELHEWGNGNLLHKSSDTNMTVLNWDGTPSPVVHQFDRHKVLSKYVYDHLSSQFRNDFWESQKK